MYNRYPINGSLIHHQTYQAIGGGNDTVIFSIKHMYNRHPINGYVTFHQTYQVVGNRNTSLVAANDG